MHTLHVELGERSYPVYIGRDLLTDPQLLAQHVGGSQVVVVSNDRVAPLYLDRVLQALGERRKVTEVILPDGERHKSLETLSRIFDQVMADGHNRTTTFIALGGGVVGDITGFAAACYQRGVNFIQLPTTLLAQVDSSVGGKTAVNHPLGKNMIGAFHQPQAVLIDTSTLQTLPAREFAAGLAEVVKYGLIADEPFYRWLQAQMPKLLAREEAALAEAVERSCSNKARIVAEDEREGGIRAILNFGHTFGHAIETAQGYGEWLHGEAVAAGMVMAAELSGIDAAGRTRLRDLVAAAGLPTAPPPVGSARLRAAMGLDKKVMGKQLRFVLLDRLGEAITTAEFDEARLAEILSACDG